MSDDDLAPYADHPVVAALRAPAQPAELAGEDAALAMFRGSPTAGAGQVRRTRHLRRVGVGSAGVVLGLALTGGVAAAYTTGLPDPVQNAFHSVLAPLGVPAPPTGHALRLQRLRRELRRAGVAVPPLQRPHQAAAPSAGPTAPGVQRPSPRPQPSSAPSAAPSPAPTPAPPPPTLSAAASRSTVPVHGSVVLSGRLTRSGTGLAGRRVYAAELVPGQSWHRVASASTGSDGSVSFTLTLTTDVRLRLVSGSGVVSSSVPVAVVPKLSLSVVRSQGKRVVTVSTDGGRSGDTLVLLRKDSSSWTQVTRTTVSAGRFTVPGPGSTRVHYRVRLLATRLHTAAYADFYVAAR
jgi:hypothetical protein